MVGCAGATVTTDLPRLTPKEARARGARALVIGVANTGGVIGDSWIPSLLEALESGLDIISGMHAKLGNVPQLKAAAERHGRRLIDVRTPPKNIPIASGAKRSGKRLFTVGTDCAVGKKYTALALARAFKQRGLDADFRATGQTGILIAGGGMPMDAVVADFEAGAAEMLSPDAPAQHWDVIEGQGSLFHPAYAGVSLGPLHGSQPDVIVVCHDIDRKEMLDIRAMRCRMFRHHRLESAARPTHQRGDPLRRRQLEYLSAQRQRRRAFARRGKRAAGRAGGGSHAPRRRLREARR